MTKGGNMTAPISSQTDQESGVPVTSHRLQYVCFQATRHGQASYAHVHEILNGLLVHGWSNELFQPRYAESTRRIGMPERLLEFLMLQWRAAWQLHRFELLYCRYHPASIPILLYARMRRIPVVVEVNGSYKDAYAMYPAMKPFRGLLNLIAQASLRLADELVAVTPGLRMWLESEVPNAAVTVIANATNAEVFHPGAPCPIPLPQAYVVFVGSLSPWQGIETILKAAELPGWPESVSVVIAGEGPLTQVVQKAAADNPRVIYVGTLPYHDIPGLTAHSIAALIPKNNILESSVTGLSPLKLYESAACGVPIIVTDLPGMSDFVKDHGCGLVIPCEDPVALAAAVKELATDPEACAAMSGRARQTIVSGNTWAHRSADTVDVLARCLKKVRS